MLSAISLCLLPIQSKCGAPKGQRCPQGTTEAETPLPLWCIGRGHSTGFVLPYKPDLLQTLASSRGCGDR